MSSHQISAAAESRRENSRQKDGRFGAQPHDKADLELADATADLVDEEGVDVEFDILGYYSSAYVSYDPDNDETTTVVDIDAPYAHVLGLDEPDDGDEPSREWLEGAQVLDELIQERFPESDLSGSGDAPSWQFATTIPGQATIDQATEAAWNDPDGAIRFANEMDSGSFGHTSIARIARERIEDGVFVAPPETFRLAAAPPETLQGDAAAWAKDPGRGVPSLSDDEARNMAAALDGPQARKLSKDGFASYSGLHAELSQVDETDTTKAYAAAALRTWADRNNDDVIDRWSQARAR